MNFKITLVAACCIAIFASCNKSDSPKKSLPTPPQDKAACSVTPKDADVLVNVDGRTLVLNSINFHRSGRYSIVTMYNGDTKADDASGYIVFTGTYTENDGVYVLSGDITATMTIDSDSGTMESDIIEGSASIQVTVTSGSVPGGSLEDFLFRSWVPKTLMLKVVGGENNSIAIDKKWDFSEGKNVSRVAQYLKEKDIDINVEEFSRYDIKEISFGADNVTVSFIDSSVSAFSGSFNVAGSLVEANFQYDLTDVLAENNPFINAKANGTVTFPGNDIVLSLEVVTDELEGTAELTLRAAN